MTSLGSRTKFWLFPRWLFQCLKKKKILPDLHVIANLFYCFLALPVSWAHMYSACLVIRCVIRGLLAVRSLPGLAYLTCFLDLFLTLTPSSGLTSRPPASCLQFQLFFSSLLPSCSSITWWQSPRWWAPALLVIRHEILLLHHHFAFCSVELLNQFSTIVGWYSMREVKSFGIWQTWV